MSSETEFLYLFLCTVNVTTLDYWIVVGLRSFINQIFFLNVDEITNQQMTAMPRLMKKFIKIMIKATDYGHPMKA